MTINDLMAFFKSVMVLKYKEVEKKISKRGTKCWVSSVGTSAPVLKVTRIVRRVKINPAKVNEIVERSLVIDNRTETFGSVNL